ncbi:uncharacterized protein [Pyrus communis]|uniref:uncharacterized protein n=1 Tax=Pyrus communis TaxID=23211 RepID=UPI0035C1603E
MAHKGQCIERFRACFFIESGFAASIDKWIQFAMEKRVEILELEFLSETIACLGEAVEFLLSNCPVLERLSLSFTGDLVSLRVVDFHFKNVPMLVEVSISKFGVLAEFLRGVFSRLSCQLFHIEIPKLDIRGAVYHQNYKFPVLSNLKHLELLVDADYCFSLVHLASFMNAAPNLQKLVLGLGFGSNVEMAKIEKAALIPHHNLKIVEMTGYCGHKCHVKHVKYWMKNNVALEKIVINHVRFWCWPTGIESNALRENEEENVRDNAIQYLKEKVPSTVELYACNSN